MSYVANNILELNIYHLLQNAILKPCITLHYCCDHSVLHDVYCTFIQVQIVIIQNNYTDDNSHFHSCNSSFYCSMMDRDSFAGQLN